MEHPARNRKGFTLIELMVALVVSGILSGVIFQFLLDQGRFVRFQSAREEVQQNTRAAVELIAGELRGLPPQGIEAGEQNSITFRAVRVWGTVCAPPANATTLHLAVPASLGTNYTVGSENTRPLLIADVSVPNATGPVPPEWSSARTVTAIGPTPSSTCNGQTLPAGLEMRVITVSSTTGISVGNPAYLYDRVRYAPGTSSVSGLWIRRRQGLDAVAFQPFAGPIRSESEGLSFRYFPATGSAPLPTPLSAVNLAEIRRIEITVESISRQKFRGNPQSKRETMTVSLRNQP